MAAQSGYSSPDVVDGWLYLQDGVYYCPNFMGGTGWATEQVLVAQDGRGYAMYFWPEQEPEMPPLSEVRREALRWLSGFSFSHADRSR